MSTPRTIAADKRGRAALALEAMAMERELAELQKSFALQRENFLSLSASILGVGDTAAPEKDPWCAANQQRARTAELERELADSTALLAITESEYDKTKDELSAALAREAALDSSLREVTDILRAMIANASWARQGIKDALAAADAVLERKS